ncbi:Cu(I)-responsive transcriptional regulator [Sinisalibacter aestuarii]|uniref:Cu(I)-responsive transcriptional regulator n=1 Tax=Sinisalibacter aestuarii TaxID=2949426 RepID=A0ABQ5LMT0_9RHOB|nr:Cu(I)-responsive transcriptional regulator [Sinisalibacter aestuarii]GKY86327.1 Cu(I)-responsive transcriptional regulator [Sinisalibacter aestuarii]
MNIKQAAEASGLPPKTIRYYEQIGLIKPARSANSYRDFSETDVHNLAFIARARALGFSIEDCRALLALYEDKSRASADVKAIAQRHLDEIEAKILQLAEMRDTLSALVLACRGNHRPDCPILASMSGD